MKTYALIAISTLGFLVTSCTHDEVETSQTTPAKTAKQDINNETMREIGDSISVEEGEPVKPKTKD